MWIEEENLEKLSYFRALGSEKGGHYTDKQKDYTIDKAISIGVRATSRLLKVPRRTIQRRLRAKGIAVKRCPDWVYEWTYWIDMRGAGHALIRSPKDFLPKGQLL